MAELASDLGISRSHGAHPGAVVASAPLGHGVVALVDVPFSDGAQLIAGKTITGFTTVEEDNGEGASGMDRDLWPWRIHNTAKGWGAKYIQSGPFHASPVRNGPLITGQQQHSGGVVARLVIEALGA